MSLRHRLAALPPHAPCRLQPYWSPDVPETSTFASTRPVQIATMLQVQTPTTTNTLPPHAPCRLQHGANDSFYMSKRFASTRPVQIATGFPVDWIAVGKSLPPHAPCRLQPNLPARFRLVGDFASTRPVQIATRAAGAEETESLLLCLHTPRADCNAFFVPLFFVYASLCLHTPRADCNIAVFGEPAS